MSSTPTFGPLVDYEVKDPWDILASVVLRIDPDSFLTKLLHHGVPAWHLLMSMATLKLVTWTPEMMASVLTGWFQSTSMGPGGWWALGAKPLTVADWCDRESLEDSADSNVADRDIGIGYLQDWAKDGAGQEGLDGLGPIFVVTDTQCGVSVLVDGSKRACAAYKLGFDRVVLHLQSHSARMLFPAEFATSVVTWGDTELALARVTINHLDSRRASWR